MQDDDVVIAVESKADNVDNIEIVDVGKVGNVMIADEENFDHVKIVDSGKGEEIINVETENSTTLVRRSARFLSRMEVCNARVDLNFAHRGLIHRGKNLQMLLKFGSDAALQLQLLKDQ